MTKISKVIENLMETKRILGDIDISFPEAIVKSKDFSLIKEIRELTEHKVYYNSPRTFSSHLYPYYSIQAIGISQFKTHCSIDFIAKDFFGSSLPLKKDIEKVFKGLAKNLNVIIKTEVKARNMKDNILSYYFEVLV